MQIFISYSTDDLEIVTKLATELKPHGDVFYWSDNRVPGENAWKTIFDWIDNSDIVVALITGSTVKRAMPIGQELGRAKTKNKFILPLVTAEIPTSQLGFLADITYQPIDLENPSSAIQQIVQQVISVKRSEEETLNNALVISLACLFFLLLWKK